MYKRIRRWYDQGLLQPFGDYWEFHTFRAQSRDLFIKEVLKLGGSILSNVECELDIIYPDRIITRPGYIVTCTPIKRVYFKEN